MAATNQRGNLPRPDHVSEGAWGLRYLGSTRGYFRRVLIKGVKAPICPSEVTRWSTANRFSSSSFSARIRAESNLLISSCNDQRSSSDIVCNATRGGGMLGFLIFICLALFSDAPGWHEFVLKLNPLSSTWIRNRTGERFEFAII